MLKLSSFAFQSNFPDVDLPEENLGLLTVDVGSFHAPETTPEPKDLDHTAGYISRIVDLKDRVKVLRQQTLTAMDQAEKSAALGQQMSSLEEQVYELQSKVARLEDGILYMTEIVEEADESQVEEINCSTFQIEKRWSNPQGFRVLVSKFNRK
jgi:hypothetical protein